MIESLVLFGIIFVVVTISWFGELTKPKNRRRR